MYNNIALLIDADNFSHSFIDELVLRVNELGAIRKMCAYGDFGRDNLRSYKAVILRHNITPVQVFSQIAGKNSSDIALVIDAMDMLYSGIYDAFVIVSNDSDFMRLAVRIKDSGVKSIGAGTTDRNKIAFDEFLIIGQKDDEAVLEIEPEEVEESGQKDIFLQIKNKIESFLLPKAPKPKQLEQPKSVAKKLPNLDELLQICTQNSKADKDGFYHCSILNSLVKHKYPDLNFESLGYPKRSKELFLQLKKEGKIELKDSQNIMKFKPKATK